MTLVGINTSNSEPALTLKLESFLSVAVFRMTLVGVNTSNSEPALTLGSKSFLSS